MSEPICAAARQTVEAVILDAGGVLLHPDLDWISARAGEHRLPLGREQLFQAYYRTIFEADRDLETGREGPALRTLERRSWFFSRLLVHAGVPEARASSVGVALAQRALAAFPRESDIYHWAMPGLRARLERLRRAGFRLGIASNNDGALADQLRSVGVIDLFLCLMDSGIEGVAKPEPELLLRAARALDAAPARCLFVGDVDRVDGCAARAAGMPFALLDPLAQPRRTAPLCLPDLDAVHRYFAAPAVLG